MIRILLLFVISCFAVSPAALGGLIKIRQYTTDGSPTIFGYSEDWTPGAFNLTDGQIKLSGALPNGSYFIAQSPQTNWEITDIVCVCYQSNVSTSTSCSTEPEIATADGEVTINLQADELVQCTFVNKPSCTGTACDPSCGNGAIDSGEQCDFGIHNSDPAIGRDECSTTCMRGAFNRCAAKAIALNNSCNQLPGRTSEVSVMLMILAALFWFARALRTRAF